MHRDAREAESHEAGLLLRAADATDHHACVHVDFNLKPQSPSSEDEHVSLNSRVPITLVISCVMESRLSFESRDLSFIHIY